MSRIDETIGNLIIELKRGTLVLSALSQLKVPRYGYSLIESLDVKGVPIDPGTLYPLLRRLEKQDLLKSEWETSGAKPRKYYVLSETGREVYAVLRKEWDSMIENMNNLMNEGRD